MQTEARLEASRGGGASQTCCAEAFRGRQLEQNRFGLLDEVDRDSDDEPVHVSRQSQSQRPSLLQWGLPGGGSRRDSGTRLEQLIQNQNIIQDTVKFCSLPIDEKIVESTRSSLLCRLRSTSDGLSEIQQSFIMAQYLPL